MSGRGSRVTGAVTVLRSPSPMPKVSVIVPVFDPGPDIDDCIESLLGQTMPAGDLELIFVDDGSTDGTPARLDELAGRHRHVRVQHIPNSGWPGKPRNVGIDMAEGEYVYFVDNDDWLGKSALKWDWLPEADNDSVKLYAVTVKEVLLAASLRPASRNSLDSILSGSWGILAVFPWTTNPEIRSSVKSVHAAIRRRRPTGSLSRSLTRFIQALMHDDNAGRRRQAIAARQAMLQPFDS